MISRLTLLSAIFPVLLSLQSCASQRDDLFVDHDGWTVMATTFEVTVYRPTSESPLTTQDLKAAYAEVAEIDRLMSLYRSDSELVALNTRAGEGAVDISPRMLEVLRASDHYARLSKGAFDVTVQPLVDLWGFYHVERAAVPQQSEIDAVLRTVGNDRMLLDARKGMLELKAATRVDLGGIAKGYAVDRALAVLRARGVAAALVNLGGNIGVMGHAPGGRPWVVGIQHPRENRLIGQIRFWRGAVATSGDYDRYFEADGKRYRHILDPRTGWPVEGIYALTVIAPNATAADALSTAAFVLGPQRGMELLDTCQGADGFIVAPVGNDPAQSQHLAVQITPHAQASSQNAKQGAAIFIEPDPMVIVRTDDISVQGSRIRECIMPVSSSQPLLSKK